MHVCGHACRNSDTHTLTTDGCSQKISTYHTLTIVITSINYYMQNFSRCGGLKTVLINVRPQDVDKEREEAEAVREGRKERDSCRNRQGSRDRHTYTQR